MIKIYGSPKSSAGRCFWCLEEVQVPYERVSINFKEREHKSENYLKLNPNGKVPLLLDNDFKIWESIAINFYLAEKYKPELLGKTLEQKALVQQWSIWAIAELQPPIIETFIQLVFVPEEKWDRQVIEKSTGKIPNLLKILDSQLRDQNYLVNDQFTLADLNVASIVGICKDIQYDISSYQNITKWLNQLSQRESFKKYSEICN